MIHFTFEEKLVIAGVCVLLIILAATILLCKLSPACPLHKVCPLSAKYGKEDGEVVVKLNPCPDDHIINYKLMDYTKLMPTPPSPKIDEFEAPVSYSPKSNGIDKNLYLDVPKPDYTNSIESEPKILIANQSRQSENSFSNSSTTSSEIIRVTPPRSRFLRANSTTNTTMSSDGDEIFSSTNSAILEISLKYNDVAEKVIIFVSRARRIPPNIYGGANDTYVQIIAGKDTSKYWHRKIDVPVDDLLRQQTTVDFQGSDVKDDKKDSSYSKLAEFQTRTVRKDAEPVYKERFVVDGVKAKEKKNVWIKFILHSIDRFSHHRIVGTRQIGLGRASTLDADLESEKFNISLDPYTPNLGEMTLSLCYLPTAARLVVTVTKVANLKPPEGLIMANPYIKASIIRRGKVLEKHTTSAQARSLNPVFSNEPLVFDVPTPELERIVLLITVVHDSTIKRSDHPESTPNEEPVRRRSVDDFFLPSPLEGNSQFHKSRSNSCVSSSKGSSSNASMGRLAFGLGTTTDADAKRHWAQILSNPRKHVIQTHKLRP